jgi:hypothetical protein
VLIIYLILYYSPYESKAQHCSGYLIRRCFLHPCEEKGDRYIFHDKKKGTGIFLPFYGGFARSSARARDVPVEVVAVAGRAGARSPQEIEDGRETSRLPGLGPVFVAKVEDPLENASTNRNLSLSFGLVA